MTPDLARSTREIAEATRAVDGAEALYQVSGFWGHVIVSWEMDGVVEDPAFSLVGWRSFVQSFIKLLLASIHSFVRSFVGIIVGSTRKKGAGRKGVKRGRYRGEKGERGKKKRALLLIDLHGVIIPKGRLSN